MTRVTRWSNREFTIDFDIDRLPRSLRLFFEPFRDLAADGYENDFITVVGLSSGFSDPGCLSGPPERCYPPEGCDDRLVTEVWVMTAKFDYRSFFMGHAAMEVLGRSVALQNTVDNADLPDLAREHFTRDYQATELLSVMEE